MAGSENTIENYREIVRALIQDYAQYHPSHGEIQIEVIFDESNDHYALVYAGWNPPYRIHGSVIHIDIREGKVIIQHDGTEDAIAERLVDAGIPRDAIVLAYLSPRIRALTDFAAD